MDKEIFEKWALIEAYKMMAEGMKAENAKYPNNPPYSEDAFFELAEKIREIGSR